MSWALIAPELVRALMHCRLPEWADSEAKSPETTPSVQRLTCLAALAALAPVPAGDALLAELYSPHLDVYQRMLILDSLTAASYELSHPEKAPTLELPEGNKGAPRVTDPGHRQGLPRPDAMHASTSQRSSDSGIVGSSGGGGGPVRVGKTRVWGQVALRKRAEAKPFARRNAFVDVALRWAGGLLREVDVVRHGVDLLGRDTLLLGRVLATLATFSEHASGTPAATPLASATLELLRSPQVHGHADAFVRRAALLAVGQVVASLPPARVAAALLAGSSSNASGVGAVVWPGSGARGTSLADEGLLERLEWVQGWVRTAAEQDMDETCRMMAEACVNIQAGAAREAMQSLTTQQGNAGSAELLFGGGPASGLLMPGAGGGWPEMGLSVSSAGLSAEAGGVLLGGSSTGPSKKAPLVVEMASIKGLH